MGTTALSLGWAAVYVAATVLAFPHLLGGSVLDLGLWLAWLPPVALLMAVRGRSTGVAAAWGFGLGVLAHAGVWHWIFVVTVHYGHAPVWVGVIAPLGLAIFPGLFTAAFAAASVGFGRRVPLSPFALAALWTALEHGRSVFLTGWPWGTLGYAQHQNDALLGLAPYAGVYALSFACVLAGASGLEWALRREPGRSSRRAAVGMATVVALHGIGALLRGPADPGPRHIRVAVLQGNVDQGVKWSPSWAERTLEIYERLTHEAAERGAEVVVWPETAVPGAPDGDPALEARLGALARDTGAALLVGAVGLAPGGSDAASRGSDATSSGAASSGAASSGAASSDAYPDLFDSALLYDPDGERRDRYDKSHLVPFGEYLPLRALLGRFIRAVATGAAGRDVTAGPGPRALVLPIGSEPIVTVGVPICYELLFPDLVRRFAGDGAQVLFAITNDAWYGRTGAPYQFLAMTALRSAETGLWTARAANTGVSALIDARGKVQERTTIFEEGLLVGDVPLREGPATFYARHGDLFAFGCWAVSVGLALRARRARGGLT